MYRKGQIFDAKICHQTHFETLHALRSTGHEIPLPARLEDLNFDIDWQHFVRKLLLRHTLTSLVKDWNKSSDDRGDRKMEVSYLP